MPTLTRLDLLGFVPTAEPTSRPQPEYFVVPTSGIGANGLPHLSWDQWAAQLDRAGVSWGTTIVTYAFRASGQPGADTGVSGFARFNDSQIQATQEMLQLWSEVANISFQRVFGTDGYSNDATMLFANFINGPSQFTAFAYLPDPAAQGPGHVEGDLWFNGTRDYMADPLNFSRGAHVLAHEIGHTLGLLHPADYNGGAQSGVTYGANAQFWQDTAQFSNMSYFSEQETGAYFGYLYASAPQMFDIAAAQLLYGANMTTRTGDTTYGFNSTAGHNVFSLTGANQITVFCIWDAGGNDTLDLSGYSSNSQIDLRDMAFSSAGVYLGTPLVGNISIAHGVVIENAVGGAGVDTIIGNSANNIFTGNAGADTISGGDGFDTANYSVASTTATWTRDAAGVWTINAGANGVDALTSVERAHFSDRDIYLDRAAQTFFGDGTSDILLRRFSDGVTAIWNVSGSTVTAAAPTQWQAGSEWAIQSIGDFNADSRDDFLLRRSDGVTAIWSMSGTTVVAAGVTQWQAGLEWQIQGVGDFNADGRDDFLWRRVSDGVTAIWNMNGTTVASADVTQWQAGLEWSIQGVGDFNGDGRDDFLWRRASDGVTAIWSMNGTAVASADVTSQQAGAGWSFIGVGDFNGDGRDDLLLRNSSGVTAVWLMNGTSVTSANVTSAQAGLEWSIASVGDYNGDGRDDLLLRHDNGTLSLWIMNGATVVSTELMSQQTGPDWGVI